MKIIFVVSWTIEKYTGFNDKTGESLYTIHEETEENEDLVQCNRYLETLKEVQKREVNSFGKLSTNNIKLTAKIVE